jgi:hypothetical protein
MGKLNPQGVKILKMFHLFFGFAWIFGAVGLLVVLVFSDPQTGDELYMRSKVAEIMDNVLIIGGATGVFLTGLTYSIWTNWGFFKHKWITIKWALIVVQMLVGTFVLGPYINCNVEISDRLRDAALNDAEFLHNVKMALIWGAVQTAFLIAYIWISVQKPWKKKRL